MTKYRKALMTAALAAGLLMPSSSALARRHTCSASIERGNTPFLMKKDRRFTRVNSPLLEDGKHLRLQLPAPYMKEVEGASSRLGAGDKTRFISIAIQRNMGMALSKLGSSRRASFYCVEPTVPEPAPAPNPVSRPQPSRTAPGERPAPAPTPAPRTDDGRRRVIFLDGPAEPARRVPPQPRPAPRDSPRVIPARPDTKPDTTMTLPVSSLTLPPKFVKGDGKFGTPHVYVVPVPSNSRKGTTLRTHLIKINISAGVMRFENYISIRFVAARGKYPIDAKLLVNDLSNLVRAKTTSAAITRSGNAVSLDKSAFRTKIYNMLTNMCRPENRGKYHKDIARYLDWNSYR